MFPGEKPGFDRNHGQGNTLSCPFPSSFCWSRPPEQAPPSPTCQWKSASREISRGRGESESPPGCFLRNRRNSCRVSRSKSAVSLGSTDFHQALKCFASAGARRAVSICWWTAGRPRSRAFGRELLVLSTGLRIELKIGRELDQSNVSLSPRQGIVTLFPCFSGLCQQRWGAGRTYRCSR
jgi:hypothetical protein